MREFKGQQIIAHAWRKESLRTRLGLHNTLCVCLCVCVCGGGGGGGGDILEVFHYEGFHSPLCVCVQMVWVCGHMAEGEKKTALTSLLDRHNYRLRFQKYNWDLNSN